MDEPLAGSLKPDRLYDYLHGQEGGITVTACQLHYCEAAAVAPKSGSLRFAREDGERHFDLITLC